jgi:hypothetical protein
MTLALLGSRALNHYQFVREPLDTDILGTYEDCQRYIKELGRTAPIVANYPADSGKKIIVKTDKQIYEFEVAWEGSDSEALLKIIEEDQFTWSKPSLLIPTLDVLYMLKLSHRFKKNSPHFLKTLNDIELMKKLGAKMLPEHSEWFKWRERETYTNHLPKLNVDKKSFFAGDGIEYEWDHDTLHEAIAYGDSPAYKLYSGGEVWSDMEKFKTLDEQTKLLGVLEECLVLAAERSQLAFNPAPDQRWSFEMALSKVCTSITSGVFRAFAYDNYYKVIDMYEEFGYNYMDKVRDGIASGVVKRLKEIK